MAYIPGVNEEEQPQNAQGGGIVGGSGQGIGGQSTPQRGTEFATIQKYLKAGQGSGADLANKIVGSIQGKGNEAINQAQSALTGLNTQLQPTSNLIQSAPTAQANVQSTFGMPTLNESYSGKYYSPNKTFGGIATPQRPAYSNDLINNLLKAQYSGPTDFFSEESAQTAGNTANRANELASLAGTEEGRMQLLKEQYGQGRSRGVNALDQALLQTSPEAKTQLQSFKPEDYFSKVKELISQGQQKVSDTQSGLSSAQAGLRNQIQSQSQALSGIKNALPSNPVTLAETQSGVGPKSSENMYKTFNPNYVGSKQFQEYMRLVPVLKSKWTPYQQELAAKQQALAELSKY
jgi:hypothetical protein